MLLEKLQESVGQIHLLDLKHSDIRMDLVSNLRNEGVKHFIVDVGSKLLDNFFDQAQCFKFEFGAHFVHFLLVSVISLQLPLEPQAHALKVSEADTIPII